MNDTGTICHGYIAVTGYIETFLMLLFCAFSCTGKKRLVFLVFEILSFISLKYLISRLTFLCQSAKYSVKQCLCHIIGIAVCCLYLAVSLIRIYAECHVGGQCPWSCCPCQEISILTLYLETYYCRTFLNCFIALCHLVGGKRGSTSGAVRYDLKSLIKKTLIPDLL